MQTFTFVTVGQLCLLLFFLLLPDYSQSLATSSTPSSSSSSPSSDTCSDTTMSKPKIFVTGANAGIGLALCKLLAKDHNVHVLLGSRNAERGVKAVEEVKAYAGTDDVELQVIDISKDESVDAAAKLFQEKNIQLYGLVNNAGVGFQTSSNMEEIMNVNFYGTKRVTEAFLPFLQTKNDDDNESTAPVPRIVMTGSGGGPMYVDKLPLENQKRICNPKLTWDDIELERTSQAGEEIFNGYGRSKALVHAYAMYIANQHPNIATYAVTPGYINTQMTSGYGATKTPEDGAQPILHALFDAPVEESGAYYGSDSKRSPLHKLRNPGDPIFDGIYPWD